eukprot:m51a1_g10632 hypothetical protein (555) ;mRNA; r:62267-67353
MALPLPMAAFIQALPQGTDVHYVLNVLRELAGDYAPPSALPVPPLSQRPWFTAPACGTAIALALCRLLGGCLVYLGDEEHCRGCQRCLWQRLWEHRDHWRSQLPSALDTVRSASWLQQALLCLALGMHPRVGVASPVQLLSPLFAREFVCSYLAPPAAFVALIDRPAWRTSPRCVKASLERPGLGVVELEVPQLPQDAAVSVAIAAHTSSAVVLAFCVSGLRLSEKLTWRSLRNTLYFFDARSGELFNSLSLVDFRGPLLCCYHAATHRLAHVTRDPADSKHVHRGVAVVSFARPSSDPFVVHALPGLTGEIWRCAWSHSGRSIFVWSGGRRSALLTRVDVATGALQSADLQQLPKRGVRQLSMLLDAAEDSGVAFDDRMDAMERFNSLWFSLERCEDGFVWLVCHDMATRLSHAFFPNAASLCCYHEASQRLALVLFDTRHTRQMSCSLAVVNVGRATIQPAVAMLPLPGVEPVIWSVAITDSLGEVAELSRALIERCPASQGIANMEPPAVDPGHWSQFLALEQSEDCEQQSHDRCATGDKYERAEASQETT